MTIDEWIEKAKLNAKVNVEYPTDEMLLQEAEEYVQLADWLEELKDHRERECNHINEALYDKCYSEGYNKAIDDFMDILLAERTQCYNFDDSEHNNPIKCVWWNDIEGIAEQLKAGGEDGNNE